MTYIIFDKKISCALRITRLTRDLDIVTIAEPVQSVRSATEFDTEDDAKFFIQELTRSNYDTSECEVHDLDADCKTEDAANDEYEAEKERAAWNRTDPYVKRNILRKMLKAKSQDEVDKFLQRMKDTVTTPMTDDEFIDYKAKEILNKYGVTVTDDQRQQMKDKLIGD